MVNCPECGKPLKKGSDGKNKYYCDNQGCNVVFVSAHACLSFQYAARNFNGAP